MEALLSQWETKFETGISSYETCKRCRKTQPMISYYDNHRRRKLCKACRDYNKIYCKKYFEEVKQLNKK